jgi:hypothetical protein
MNHTDYWFKEYLRRARHSRTRAVHKLRMGDRFDHRWYMRDAIFFIQEAKKMKAAA